MLYLSINLINNDLPYNIKYFVILKILFKMIMIHKLKNINNNH